MEEDRHVHAARYRSRDPDYGMDAYGGTRLDRRPNVGHLVGRGGHPHRGGGVEAASSLPVSFLLAPGIIDEPGRLYAGGSGSGRRLPAHGRVEPQVAQLRDHWSDVRLQHDNAGRRDDPLGFLDAISRSVRRKLFPDPHDGQPSRAHSDGRSRSRDGRAIPQAADERDLFPACAAARLVDPGPYRL